MDFEFQGTTQCERNPNPALALRSLYKEKTSGTPETVERVTVICGQWNSNWRAIAPDPCKNCV